jgi:hypothetical protein
VQQARERLSIEHPAMKELFGVTRQDLYDIGGRRVGNIEPSYVRTARGGSSESAQRVMTPENAQRIQDALVLAHPHWR